MTHGEDKVSIDTFVRQLEARTRSFGSSRSPLEIEIGDDRIVVAGPQVLRIPVAWSFREFLISYGLGKIGRRLVAQERDRENARHPLARQLITSRLFIGKDQNDNDVTLADDKMSAFISVSWDLFTVSDNVGLQDELVRRMQKPDLYQGARYELFVAASFLRAGFKIQFEDETDTTTTHCELTATHPKTNHVFSVEAKSRHRDSQIVVEKAGVYRMLQKSLAKVGQGERIVFIDVNLPHDTTPIFGTPWHREVTNTLTRLEDSQNPNSPWPKAIVFFTNGTFSTRPTSHGAISSMIVTGINHPAFKQNDRVIVERAYPDVGLLCHAVDTLSVPPTEFPHQERRSTIE